MRNLLIATVVIVGIGVIGYFFSRPAEETADSVTPTPAAIELERTATQDPSGSEAMDLSGIHIMADGAVMLGDGTTVPDASVNADGMIVLPDGRIVEPAMDMR